MSLLCGPIYLLTLQSRALAEKLRDGKPDAASWHLLEHLDEVVASPPDRALADQILTVNREIEKRIFDHAGLLDQGTVPPSFEQFLGHFRYLQIAFKAAKQNDPLVTADFTAKHFQTYPRLFDKDVKDTYDKLHKARRSLLTARDSA